MLVVPPSPGWMNENSKEGRLILTAPECAFSRYSTYGMQCLQQCQIAAAVPSHGTAPFKHISAWH